MNIRKCIGVVALALVVSIGCSLYPKDANAAILYGSFASNPGIVLLFTSTYNTSANDGLIWDSMHVKAYFSYPGGYITTQYTGGPLAVGEVGAWVWTLWATPVTGRYIVRGNHKWHMIFQDQTSYTWSSDDYYIGLHTP